MNADGSGARKPVLRIPNFSSPSWGRATATAPALTSAPTKLSTSPKTASPTLGTSKPIVTSTPTVAPKPSVAPKPKPTPVTAARPAPSSDALRGAKGLIAVRGNGGLYLVQPSTARSNVIPGTREMWAPAWSPDAKQLAVEKSEKNGSSSIYTIRPDGTRARLVLENASAPSWSASGDRIFAVRSQCAGPCASDEDADKVLYAVNTDGTGAQRVDFDDADAYTSRELAWPVDGSAIHFFDEASLSGPGTFDSDAATWSPDEATLAFTGALHAAEDETADNGLWVVSANGGTPKLLLSDAVGRPSWAR
jgi:Tol biopolymer transport system component